MNKTYYITVEIRDEKDASGRQLVTCGSFYINAQPGDMNTIMRLLNKGCKVLVTDLKPS